MLSGLTQTSYNSDGLSRSRARRWRRPRPRCGCRTWHQFAPSDTDGIDAPAFAGTAVIAGHSPKEFSASGARKRRYVHSGRDETGRVSAPCLTTSNGTTAIVSDRAVVAACDEAPAGGKNVLKCIPTISADLQHTAIEADVGIWRRFKIEILAE